jgi:uncharacterized protein
MPPPLSSLLLKPAGPDCNLACGYCFYRPAAALFPRDPHPRMTHDTLRAVVSQYMLLSETPAFAWQGGEPTLMGVEFFRTVVALQQKHGHPGQVVANSLQTNGVLLDDEWARFLARYRFLVGLSLDGPAEIHDHYRRHRNAQPSLAEVLSGLATLRRHEVETNALTLVTARSLSQVATIYAFLRDQGLEFLQFIPCVEKSPRSGRPLEFCVEPRAYGDFLCHLFDLWLPEHETVHIRLFDDLLASLLGRTESLSCTFRDHCGDYVVVEHNGDVFCCDFFVDEAHCLGNLSHQPLSSLLESPHFVEFAAAKRRFAARCRACSWLPLCQGGCPKHRGFVSSADSADQYLCAAYEAFFTYAVPRLQPLVDRLRLLLPQ